MAGSYVKLSLLGEGTFGRAWLVKKSDTQKKYVVKEIKVQGLSESEKEQTLTEVRALAKCKHVNIIRYREAYVDRAQLCIAMEYADGGDLQRKIVDQKDELFSEELIIDWFVQICFALKYIHKLNILHRDLKSQNIFLTSDNIVKVGDFGIARFLQDTLDHATTVIGTPFYLSPEICQKNSYNHKSDMWAAGCILYELCTLKYPFNGCNITSLMVQILQGKYEHIPSRYGALLEDLISVLLKQDPSLRPSADQVLCIPAMQPYVNHYVKRSTVMKEVLNTPSPGHLTKFKKPGQDKENVHSICKTKPSIRAKSWGTPPKVMPLAERRKAPSSADVRTKQWHHVATPAVLSAPKVALYQDVLKKRSESYSSDAEIAQKNLPKLKLMDMCKVKRAGKLCSKTYVVKGRPQAKVTPLHQDSDCRDGEGKTKLNVNGPSDIIPYDVQENLSTDEPKVEECSLMVSEKNSSIGNSSGYSSFESRGERLETVQLSHTSLEISKKMFTSVAKNHEEMMYKAETIKTYLESKFGSHSITDHCSLIRESILADIDFNDIARMLPDDIHDYIPLIIHMIQLDLLLK